MIKYTIILALFCTNLTAQSPFDDFKDDNKKINIHQLEDNIEFKIVNEERNSLISYGVLRENKLYFYDKNENLVLLYTLDNNEDKFLSRDPKEKSFVGISPFTFGMNNPISYIDPYGDSTFSAGNEQDKFSSSIEARHPNLQVETIDMKQDIYYQKISIKPGYNGPISEEASTLIEASESKEVNVFMVDIKNTEEFVRDINSQGRIFIAGGTYGSKEKDKKGNNYGISYLNYNAIEKYISNNISEKGDITSHETIEMYISIRDDLNIDQAHYKTLKIAPTAETEIIESFDKQTNEYVNSIKLIGPGRPIEIGRVPYDNGNVIIHQGLINLFNTR